MAYIVETSWLADRLGLNGGSAEKTFIADCRFLLSDPESGKRAYLEGHLPGAVYIDLEKHLSGPVTQHGGRHPLPEPEVLAQRLGLLGIDRETPVVAYDDQGGMFASRLWWVLHYLGHEQVYVLNGGFADWAVQGLPVEQGERTTAPTELVAFEAKPLTELLVSREEVKARLHDPSVFLIDSREPKRYRGEEEPIDKAAGHVPGAANYFWKDVLAADGRWKNADGLKEQFSGVPADKEIIVYCGSGVSACPNVLSLNEAGFAGVRLYAGSWSDWISYEDGEIAVGGE
ncbi:sulfurtransferase [Paenibacillus sp. NPDC058071]|uniref:sulfurtransferase n=1 Tax=Paenibacillus sp. NPDC058071 TaxID=3346326 RepID=UPI0036DB0EF4